MVGITPPKKPHFRLLRSNPELKIMLVQCHEVIHTPLTCSNHSWIAPWCGCLVVHNGSMLHCVLVEQNTFYSVANIWATG